MVLYPVNNKNRGRFLMDALENISILNQEISFLGSGQFFANMVVALICGLLIALFYRWTYGRPKYSPVFVNSLIALSMITTIVITVIGNNLARAFGLVGALSIIRFRLSIKDIKDIVFIFFALTVGMAAGVDLLLIPIVGTIFIGIVIFVLSRTHGDAPPRKRTFTLAFSFTPSQEPGMDPAPYQTVMETHCKQSELTRAKPSRKGNALALSYSVDLKSDGESLIRELVQVPGVTHLVLTKTGSKGRKKRKGK
jgi:uncharacterized membrane protein YhiD involved in acid resistance